MQDTRQNFLSDLGRQTEATVSELAEAVGLASVAVRSHLNVLRERVHVLLRSQPVGRGRPGHVYSLSSNGAGSLRRGGWEALAMRMIEMIKDGDHCCVYRVRPEPEGVELRSDFHEAAAVLPATPVGTEIRARRLEGGF